MDKNEKTIQHLYLVQEQESDGCLTYVFGTSIVDALNKWKTKVAEFYNEDFRADGVDRVMTAAEVDDPEAITLVAYDHQVML